MKFIGCLFWLIAGLIGAFFMFIHAPILTIVLVLIAIGAFFYGLGE